MEKDGAKAERMTRSIKVDAQKEMYEKMTIEECRANYKCGDKFLQLASILPWSEYGQNLEKKQPDPDMEEEEVLAATGGKKISCNPNLNGKVSLWKGDITRLEIDAIVNAANKTLLGGGGVDGSIHRAAGPTLKAECATLHGCETGQAKITGGYKLPAKNVIHTVGPIGENPNLLQSCYTTSLNLALQQNLRSIGFPCISTGLYDYPAWSAAQVALQTTRNFLEEYHDQVERIIFCVFLAEDEEIYQDLLPVFFPLEDR